jgi:hypothetical protein
MVRLLTEATTPAPPQHISLIPERPQYRFTNRPRIVPGIKDECAGREQFTVGVERSGCRRALRRGKGLSNGQPREGEPDWHKWIAESLGGIAFRLRDRQLGFTMEAAR